MIINNIYLYNKQKEINLVLLCLKEALGFPF